MTSRRGRSLDDALRRFERDRTSGASELAARAVELLQRAQRGGADAADLDRLRQRIGRAHPTMAAVWNAAHAAEPQRFLEESRDRLRRAVRHARRLLPQAGVVVTLSYSGTVLEVLRGRRGTVIVGQSLPGGEGEKTAARLRRLGSRVQVIPDAQLSSWVAAADVALLGADAVVARGVINKVGSRLLALAAKVERCPCYVVADTSKFASRSAPFPTPLLGPGAWFEIVEFALIWRIVTEQGALTGRLIERRLTGA